ncbi:MAG: CRTAC1 family protein [Caldilineaceae bacterium]
MSFRYARHAYILAGLIFLLLASGIVSYATPGGLSFTNQTTSAGLTFRHETALDVQERGSRMMGGAAAGDFNNDGWVDIFVIGGGRRADALFVNQQNGTFVDKAQAAGLSALHIGSGAAVADYNGDGWLDIYVTSFGPPDAPAVGHHKLYRNNGDGTFTDVAYAAGVNRTSPEIPDGMGASFGDYDLDGDLDLFVAGWAVIRDPQPRSALGNRLFRNNGDGTFTDITDQTDIGDKIIHGFSPCFVDMDGDGYPEITLVSDFGSTRYLVNNRDGTFTIREVLGATRPLDAMGSTIADFNWDGRLDWYISEIYDDSGNGRGEGNKLYLNQGNHTYTEVGQAAGVDDGGWGWGTVAVDLDQNGWLDIVETNGWPLPEYENELAKVWINNGNGTFSERAENLGLIHRLHGLGVIALDVENDGDMDIVITAANDTFNFYRNDLDSTGSNWLQVRLNSKNAPKVASNGVGSRVIIRAGDHIYTQPILACPSYLSQGELAAHFGLGALDAIDELRVEWSDGSQTTLFDLSVNRSITVDYTGDLPADCPTGGCAVFLPVVQTSTMSAQFDKGR